MDRWWLYAALLGGWLWHSHRRKQEQDLLLRGFAADQFASPTGDFEQASEVASEAGLPIQWVIDLQQRGVPPHRLREAAARTRAAVKVPRDTSVVSLAEVREQALAAGGAL